jgi:drug/metabolite transporter (DMT)-like permease
MAKSVLVGASWTFAFFALQQLPLSIAAPIRATSPFWVILIATIAFGERPTAIQWLGMGVVLVGFWRFSLVGRREGIRFTRDRSVGLMIAATWLGACSSIYDKWLLQYAGLDPVTMQAWFTIDLVPVMIPLALRWLRGAVAERRRDRSWRPFRWRATILLVSPLLILADFFYFIAVANPEAMISVVSVLRRSSVVLALCFGARALSEANFRAKLACVGLILAGVVLLTWHG